MARRKKKEFILDICGDTFEETTLTLFANSLEEFVEHARSLLHLKHEVEAVQVFDRDFGEWARVVAVEDIPAMGKVRFITRALQATAFELRDLPKSSLNFKEMQRVLSELAAPWGLEQLQMETLSEISNPTLIQRFQKASQGDEEYVVTRLFPCSKEFADQVASQGFFVPDLPAMYGKGIVFPASAFHDAKMQSGTLTFLVCSVLQGRNPMQLAFRDATLSGGTIHAKGFTSVLGPRDLTISALADLVVYDEKLVNPTHQLTMTVGASEFDQVVQEPATKGVSLFKELRGGPPQCREHDRALDVFCESCNQVVCSMCLLVGSHKGHQGVVLSDRQLDTLFKEYLPKAQPVLEALKPRYENLQRAKRTWEAKLKEVEDNRDRRRKEIKGAFAELKFELATRELLTSAKLEKDAERKLNPLLETARDFRARAERMHQCAALVRVAREEQDHLALLVYCGELLYELDSADATLPSDAGNLNALDKRTAARSVEMIKGISFAAGHQVHPSHKEVKEGSALVIEGAGFSRKTTANVVLLFHNSVTYSDIAVLSASKDKIIVDIPTTLKGEGEISCQVVLNGGSSGDPVPVGVFVPRKPQVLAIIRNGAFFASDGVTVSATDPASISAVVGTERYHEGPHYWEVEVVTASAQLIGISTPDNIELLDPYGGAGCWLFQSQPNGITYLWHNGQRYTYGEPLEEGDSVGVLLDLGDQTLEFFRNGTSMGVAFSEIDAKEFVAAVCLYPGGKIRMNWQAQCPRPLMTPRSRVLAMGATKRIGGAFTKAKGGTGGTLAQRMMRASKRGGPASPDPSSPLPSAVTAGAGVAKATGAFGNKISGNMAQRLRDASKRATAAT